MIDYKEKIKQLVKNLYQQGSPTDFDLKLTTKQLVAQLSTIIPENALDEFIVTECMEELEIIPLYEKKSKTIERKIGKDEKGKPIIEKDIIEFDDLVYFWYLKKK